MAELDAFHFLRPAWLAALIAIGLIWYLVRPRKPAQDGASDRIAPHLAKALQVGRAGTRKIYPIDLTALALVLLTLSVAGPTWSRVPNPLITETAPLVIALKVTPSMETPDLAPTRLDRGRFKILDLIAARAAARWAVPA